MIILIISDSNMRGVNVNIHIIMEQIFSRGETGQTSLHHVLYYCKCFGNPKISCMSAYLIRGMLAVSLSVCEKGKLFLSLRPGTMKMR
jgi:hypothetical protein